MKDLSWSLKDSIIFTLKSSPILIIWNTSSICIILEIQREDKINKSLLINSKINKRKLNKKKFSMMTEKMMKCSSNKRMTHCAEHKMVLQKERTGNQEAIMHTEAFSRMKMIQMKKQAMKKKTTMMVQLMTMMRTMEVITISETDISYWWVTLLL